MYLTIYPYGGAVRGFPRPALKPVSGRQAKHYTMRVINHRGFNVILIIKLVML